MPSLQLLNWMEFIPFSAESLFYSVLSLWVCAELVFFIVFYAILIPYANRHVIAAGTNSRNQSSSKSLQTSSQEKKTNPCRAPYHIHKHLLLRRTLYRMLMDSNALIEDDLTGPPRFRSMSEIHQAKVTWDPDVVQKVVTDFITSCFHPPNYSSDSTKLSQATSFVSSNITYLPARIRLVRGYSTISSSSHDSANSSSSDSNMDNSGSDSGTEDNTMTVRSGISSNSDSIPRLWTISNIYKSEADDFLAWSLFNKHMQQMTSDDLTELQKCYQEMESIVGLTHHESEDASVLEQQSSPLPTDAHSVAKLVPRRLSLEYVRAWHRPLLAYVVVYFLRNVMTRLILQYCFGFVRVRSKTSPQLTGWYRPSKCSVDQSRMPIVFFHGIAPAGVLFYLPMLLMGSDIASSDRCCLLIDHYNISYTLQFDALSELETVAGVNELIDSYFPNPSTTPIAVCGHSFGSCCISWLLNHPSKLQRQIQLCILLDPVSILLSDPHVMNRFLYSDEVLTSVRVVASSELFIEYYLRHHFSWYNSELCLDEILLEHPPEEAPLSLENQDFFNQRKSTLHVLVALSEKDAIVNAPKVKQHIDLFSQRHSSESGFSAVNRSKVSYSSNRLRTLYWKQAPHASCVTDPRKWRDIRQAMYQCELDSLRSP